ncbi:MAG TPA: TonB-dependent receptor [Cytophagales bacterium]|nr:TonB-dependent receptor [Cytophagales bacterium]
MNKFFFLIIGLAMVTTYAQQTQTIRGVVTDKQSKSPLEGVLVTLIDSGNIATLTDAYGEYRLDGVRIGRRSIKFTYEGYSESAASNILVQQGKESIANVELEEEVTKLEDVVIQTGVDKTGALNENATNSVRQFTVEETSRYAGSLNDPSRMASNFAGVSGANDGRNDIIIRGNSPLGLLWRLEGMPIPNPNHFSVSGTTGGPVSMLNYNLLANSDFMTSAFPAEYGNAVSGVFDLNMRSGNNKKREYLGQVGFNGFEFGAEGPFSKKSRASYLINYRYSTLGVFKALGMNFGTGAAIPQYQDLSFKVNLPTGAKGQFQIFGVGGLSYVELLDSKQDTTKKDELLYGNGGMDQYFRANTGMAGMSYNYFLNHNTSFKIGLLQAGAYNFFRQDSLSTNYSESYENLKFKTVDTRTTFTVQLNKKITAKTSFQVGTYLTRFGLNTKVDYHRLWLNDWISLRNYEGSAYLSEVYLQGKYRFNTKLTLNAGVHTQHFTLGNAFAVEPRVGVKYQLTDNQALSLGTGIHNQSQALIVYANRTRHLDGTYSNTNENLGFTRAYHAVLGYDLRFSQFWRVKAESYYQYLDKVPVERRPGYYSLLNSGADFGIDDRDSLINKGTGFNYGLELTVERFLSKGFYSLLTTSLFDSKYKGSDGVLRNTAFNGNYVVNVLAGKEFKLGPKSTFMLDLKATVSGGKRYNPIDMNKSKLEQRTALDYTDPYGKQRPMYFRPDLKLTYRKGSKNGKFTQEFSISLTNFVNHKNIFTESYDKNNDKVIKQYQQGFLPIPQYRILF